MPFCSIASMIALEHGAQHVWRRTVVSPIGACILLCFLFVISTEQSEWRNLHKDNSKFSIFAPLKRIFPWV